MGTLEEEVGRRAGAAGGLNRAMLGASYTLPARVVEADEMIAFAEATEDANPRHVDRERDGGIIAAPLFPQRLLHRAMEEALTDEALGADLLRLVHGEQDMRLHRPLRPGDRCAARAEIVGIEDKSSGQLLTVRMWLDCQDEVVSEATASLFIRAPRPQKPAAKPTRAEPSEPDDRQILHEESQFVSADQSRRYAEASGDRNPIHTDVEVAKAAGLDDVILHGMCTMAFAAKAVVDGVCGGDSRRLGRIKVRFSKPVLPEQTVTTRIWMLADDADQLRLGLEAHDDAKQLVLSHGLAEVRRSA